MPRWMSWPRARRLYASHALPPLSPFTGAGAESSGAVGPDPDSDAGQSQAEPVPEPGDSFGSGTELVLALELSTPGPDAEPATLEKQWCHWTSIVELFALAGRVDTWTGRFTMTCTRG